MESFQQHQAGSCFKTTGLQVYGYSLNCKYRNGMPLITRAQVFQDVAVVPRLERVVASHLDCCIVDKYFIIEQGGSSRPYQVRTSLTLARSTPFVRVLNLGNDTVHFKKGRSGCHSTTATIHRHLSTKLKPLPLNTGFEVELPEHMQTL